MSKTKGSYLGGSLGHLIIRASGLFRISAFGLRHSDCIIPASCLAVLILTATGCDTGLKTYPAAGTVHFTDGEPLPGGVVIFHAADSGVQAKANIWQDGSFRLGTQEATDGAVAGKHRVTVRANWQSPDTPPAYPVHRKYHRPETSDLEYEVTPEGPNEFEIVVDRRQ